MTKKEAIQKAYGDRFSTLEHGINEDGVYIGDTELISDEEFNSWDFIAKAKNHQSGKEFVSGNRPKSISGIEDNNGWVKIESEADLPTTYAIFNACYLDLPVFHTIKLPVLLDSYYKGLITHYQIVEIPKPPIY